MNPVTEREAGALDVQRTRGAETAGTCRGLVVGTQRVVGA